MVCRPIYYLAVAAFIASLFLPPAGFGGFSICAFKNATAKSCFGCGMTRGITSITQLQPDLAWTFHPFAFLLWPMMILLALAAIPHFRRGFERQIAAQDHWITPTFWTIMSGFFLFGIARLIFGEAFWL